jgi:maltodextrin utilization protein YvdJ
MKWFLSVFVLFFLISCTLKEITYQYINNTNNFKLNSYYIKNYVLGKKITINTGEKIVAIKKANDIIRPAYQSTNDFALPKGSELDMIPKMYVKSSEFYHLCGKSDSGIYISKHLYLSSNQDVIEINNDGYILRGACLYRDEKMFAYWKGDYKSLSKFESVNEVTNKVSKYHFELSYTGKSGNVIKLSYREFENDKVRSAFNQELEFDISDDNKIGFKGMIIKIHSATNSSLEYEVIDEGSLNWVIFG